MAEHTSRQGFRAFACVLRNRNFFWLWISQLISMIGDFFSYLAVPFLITALADGGEVAGVATEAGELSAEAKALVGLATLAFTAPRFFLSSTRRFCEALESPPDNGHGQCRRRSGGPAAAAG